MYNWFLGLIHKTRLHDPFVIIRWNSNNRLWYVECMRCGYISPGFTRYKP